MLCTLLISGSVFPHSLPVGESERLPVERRPRRVRKRSLTFLACSSSSRFFCRSSSESCSSGSWSFTRSITLPVLSKRDKNTHVRTQKKKCSNKKLAKSVSAFGEQEEFTDGCQPINQLRRTGQIKDVVILSPSLLRKGQQQKHSKHVGEHADRFMSQDTDDQTKLKCF